MSTSYTYKLKGARWLRMWTAADRSSVYAAQSEAQKIADTLCDVPWTRAKSDGPAMFPLTAAKSLDENPANRDLFDAALFCADHSDGAHRAYANAAKYLFELPTTTGVHLNSVKVHVESDAYNALGARIAVHLLSSAELPTDCATVRTGAAHAEGVAARRTEERDGRNYWYSNWADVTITGGTSESPAAIGDLKQYLAVFVGMENYATSRNEWLEGASYIRNLIEIETDAVVTGWTDGGTYDCSDAGTAVLLSGGSSPTWLQPLPTVNVGNEAPTVSPDAEQVDTFFTASVSTRTPLESVWTITGSTGHVSFEAFVRFRGEQYVGGHVRCVGPDFHKADINATPKVPWATDEVEEIGDLVERESDSTRFLAFDSAMVGGYVPASGTSIYTQYGFHFRLVLPVAFSAIADGDGYYRISSPKALWYEASMAVRTLSLDSWSTSNYRTEGKVETAERIYEIGLAYYMLRMAGGAPNKMDICDSPDESAGRGLASVVSGDSSPWTVTVGGQAFTVTVSGRAVTLAESPSGQSWIFTLSEELAGQDYFDPAVRLLIPGEGANEAVADYGMASVVGDLSHAVATFEAGLQPPHAEVLGRLVRMSRAATGGMFYLHPESGALAEELDVLRPVPRFWRASADPTGQTDCQPGLSVWYSRPTTTENNVTTASAADLGIVQRAAPGKEGVVSNPAFLQLVLLALRAPSAFGTRLVLQNFKPDTTTPTTNVATAVTNHFALRFVAWRSPAEQWDGSNAFAMAAMASMPSIYRADGPASVAWSVDCTGGLLRFGTRNMTAERIGISKTIIGNIAASAEIEIPIASPVGEGDVVLIAPEVLGFADGAGGASKWFGRPSDPSLGTAGWARYAHNLGWFPRVTGE